MIHGSRNPMYDMSIMGRASTVWATIHGRRNALFYDLLNIIEKTAAPLCAHFLLQATGRPVCSANFCFVIPFPTPAVYFTYPLGHRQHRFEQRYYRDRMILGTHNPRNLHVD